jgi:peptide-methionine (R)-S-oxide reductase
LAGYVIKAVMRFIILLLYIPLFASCQPKSTANTTASTDDLPFYRSEADWKSTLSPEQYHILREKGTDRPFTGIYTDHFDKGEYHCAGCGQALFTSDMKFASDCGWPSFDKELEGERIIKKIDRSYGMTRIEILCGRCGSHLGHLFDDGPTLTGKRYCVNSTSLQFEPHP